MRYLRLLFLFVVVAPCAAQSIEYGKPAELRGITKVFVDAGMDVENRQLVIKEIEKAKLTVSILDSSDKAEVILKFDGGKEQVFATGTGRAIHVGKGVVFVQKGATIRVLFSMEGAERKLWDDKPAANFGKMFVKELKIVNGIK